MEDRLTVGGGVATEFSHPNWRHAGRRSHLLDVALLPRVEILPTIDNSLRTSSNERRRVNNPAKAAGPRFF